VLSFLSTAPPPPQQDASYAQILEVLAALQEGYEFHAAGCFFYAAVYFYYVAGGSLCQPLCGAEPVRHPGVSQAPPSVQQ
jgi:hypothetical protein